jgi:SpoVK/Ycf46/Vps4 family AAA+-type ATPase
LQRVEEYAGVVILATNLRQNMDEAFMRRIHYLVDFPFPSAEARYALWLEMLFSERTIPPHSDITETNLRDLARRFQLSAANIRNVVRDAAFRSMAEGAAPEMARITPRHLVDAIARENQKGGKPISIGDFGPIYYAWIEEDILLSQSSER